MILRDLLDVIYCVVARQLVTCMVAIVLFHSHEPKKTSARNDNIIKLKMFLIDAYNEDWFF